MCNIEYSSLEKVDAKDLMDLLNETSLREHLIDHPYFDTTSIQDWIEDKIKTDALPACKIRVVSIDGKIAGWCGIQPDDSGFEIAIVISRRFWGSGIPVFKTLMQWAADLGHRKVVFHLLDTRPEYRALAKMASRVHRTKLLGRNFTTYHLSVGQFNT